MAASLVAVIDTHSLGTSDFVLQEEWVAWKAEHGKSYDTVAEENQRLDAFLENKRLIAEHNERYYQNLETYVLKMNHFGDTVITEHSHPS